MVPPQGSKTKQGYELQLGTNNVAPFLFTKFLTPILQSTAKTAPPGSVRVVWTASSAADHFSPKGGVDLKNLDYKVDKTAFHKYGVSKAGNIFHAKEYEKRYGSDGIVSVVSQAIPPQLRPRESDLSGAWVRFGVCVEHKLTNGCIQSLDPGNLKTDLQRYVPGWQNALLSLSLHTPIHGAYTELFAGLSPDVPSGNTRENWIAPWGRFVSLRKDIAASTKTKEEGGTRVAEQFWNWTEEQVKPYE
jgi:hypothetical protein